MEKKVGCIVTSGFSAVDYFFVVFEYSKALFVSKLI